MKRIKANYQLIQINQRITQPPKKKNNSKKLSNSERTFSSRPDSIAKADRFSARIAHSRQAGALDALSALIAGYISLYLAFHSSVIRSLSRS